MAIPYINHLNIIYITCRGNNSSINQGGKKKKGNEERGEEGEEGRMKKKI